MQISKSRVSSCRITIESAKDFVINLDYVGESSTKTSSRTTFSNTHKIRLKTIIRIDTIKIKCTCDNLYPAEVGQLFGSFLSTLRILNHIIYSNSNDQYPLLMFTSMSFRVPLFIHPLIILSLFLLATRSNRNNLFSFISSVQSVAHVLKKKGKI